MQAEYHIFAGYTYDIEKLAGTQISKFAYYPAEPGDFYFWGGHLKFDAVWDAGDDHVHNDVELDYDKKNDVVRKEFDFFIHERPEGVGRPVYDSHGRGVLNGNDGGDYLLGVLGNDTLKGKGSDDILDGGEGKDKLVGGTGNDHLVGGAGADQFYVGSGLDTIYDFESGKDLIYSSEISGGKRPLTTARLQEMAVVMDGGTMIDVPESENDIMLDGFFF